MWWVYKYWFVGNKLRIHFEEYKTKLIVFGTKHRLTQVSSLDIIRCKMHIKQYHTVTYRGCSLDENLSEESIALKFTNHNY